MAVLGGSGLNRPMHVRLTADQTGAAISVFEETIPSGAGVPLHAHLRADEVIYVRQGQLRFQHGERLSAANAGSIAFIPHGTPHSWQNPGPGVAYALFAFVPRGGEQYLVELSRIPAHDMTPERIAELDKKFGWQTLGPGLADLPPRSGR